MNWNYRAQRCFEKAGFNRRQEGRPRRFSPFSSQLRFTLFQRVDIVRYLDRTSVCGQTTAEIPKERA